jgi:hypothetical protein
MFRKVGCIFVLSLFAVTPCYGQEWAQKMFKVADHDFGSVARGAKAEFSFGFENLFLEDVHVAGELRLHDPPSGKCLAEDL